MNARNLSGMMWTLSRANQRRTRERGMSNSRRWRVSSRCELFSAPIHPPCPPPMRPSHPMDCSSHAAFSQDILESAKVNGPAAAALGPPDIKPQHVALSDLPRGKLGRTSSIWADSYEADMPQYLLYLLKADMRLIPIAVLLTWTSLKVYEEVDASSECLQMPYEAVTDGMWATTCILSWRWGKEKPLPLQIPHFSPMTERQWAELHALMKLALHNGMVHVWIDWSCIRQYSKRGAMITTEVLRKLYYARAGTMVVVPTFVLLPTVGPITMLLKLAVKFLQKRAGGSPTDGGIREGVTALVLHALLEKNSIASTEYFERVWTLTERIARHGRSERLCQWMSLEAWIGMVLDGLIKGENCGVSVG